MQVLWANGPGRTGGLCASKWHPPQADGAKEDFDPVLNDATWLHSLRLHKYTPNFEGMSWKGLVLMDEQALEAQGVAALGARKKMLKTFEVVRKKMVIDSKRDFRTSTICMEADSADNPTQASEKNTTLYDCHVQHVRR